MYSRFFGFKERPFKLLPDPAYLFLSKSHEEALAHLKYAVAHGDGFVEITGEVGTGKTTLCRVFLERLPENTEAAYIFNPKLNSVQLLKAINDEFGIDATADNTKDLIDRLNVFLMQQKADGRNVILLIDEAQNLSVEVLEQLRLLSNLETTRSKLIQIILVGQPELAEMLDSHELRQLGQRITLSCHLAPLTLKETSAYIEHRLQVALAKQERLFSREALKEVHTYAGGIPRLINIVCDRSLLIAYSRNQKKISGKTVRMAIREIASRGELRKRSPLKYRAVVAAGLGLAVVLGILVLPGILRREAAMVPARISPAEPASAPETPQPEASAPQAEASTPETEAPPPSASDAAEAAATERAVSLEAFLERTDASAGRHHAMKELLALWHVENPIQAYLDSIEDDRAYFNLVARQHGLLVQAIQGDPALIGRLNLPAIFRFESVAKTEPKYLTLTSIQDGQARFVAQDTAESVIISYAALVEKFRGTAFVVWKNYLGFEGTIPLNHPKGSVIMLKMLLRELGYDALEIDPVYSPQTQAVVRSIQQKYAIKADGYVGPLTKIVLYLEKGDLPAPRLVSAASLAKGSQN